MADTGSGIPGSSGNIATSPSTATVVVSSSESIDSASEPESEQEDQSGKTTAPPSLLSKLWASQPSDFARKRRVTANPPPQSSTNALQYCIILYAKKLSGAWAQQVQ